MYLNSSRRAFFCQLIAAILLDIRGGADGLQTGANNSKAEANNSKKDAVAEVYEPGGSIKAPKLLHYVEPEFSSKSKEAFIEGTVKISTVVTAEGRPSEPRIVHGLNAEEDRTAIEALKQWRFQPGTKDGKPVNVRVMVEVAFHLL
ncbi:MAG: energy transducer TonB [Acidobacteriaceae bacterium]|nr:energy transducer TonB [Acidobacteriaceae bacterium]MBV9224296.1 energy transducer TonB [Acidobacteriaceae bacterium]MBV9309002.1 energy transducer TonB [Acidobacteriaceae bacterium]